LLAGNNIDCEPDRFRSACKIHCHDRVGLQSFSLGRTFLGNHYGAALTEHVIGKPAITMDLKKFIAGLAAGYRKLTVYEAGRKAGLGAGRAEWYEAGQKAGHDADRTEED
jgi:hypothetical protein